MHFIIVLLPSEGYKMVTSLLCGFSWVNCGPGSWRSSKLFMIFLLVCYEILMLIIWVVECSYFVGGAAEQDIKPRTAIKPAPVMFVLTVTDTIGLSQYTHKLQNVK